MVTRQDLYRNALQLFLPEFRVVMSLDTEIPWSAKVSVFQGTRLMLVVCLQGESIALPHRRSCDWYLLWGQYASQQIREAIYRIRIAQPPTPIWYGRYLKNRKAKRRRKGKSHSGATQLTLF
ncbi:hypothetical protein ACQ4M3_13265 [Leptolyngbya sp. AN03gr2]|uniref:hypothetical protein n=1 Tax=unclassified Leptolyngbya TaxID=2650499 RepID=UPI003D314B97